jgi:hypothetical protein
MAVDIGLSRFIGIPSFTLVELLGVFAGFVMSIGASELPPRSRGRRPRLSTLAATPAGFLFIYLVIRLAGSSLPYRGRRRSRFSAQSTPSSKGEPAAQTSNLLFTRIDRGSSGNRWAV